jgi:cytochrome c553
MTIISPNHAAIRSALVWSIALAGLTLATASWAEDARKGTVAEKEVQAKLQYCKVCHGVSAQGFRGYYPIPRLAGQQPPYLENQLQAFIERRRTNNVMFNVAHSTRLTRSDCFSRMTPLTASTGVRCQWGRRDPPNEEGRVVF